MLLVQHIRDHYDQVLAGLKKRNLTNAVPALQQVLALDDLRKSSQTQRDQLQAEANTISKEIGTLMKEGKTAEATAVRDRSALLKNQIKELEDLGPEYDSAGFTEEDRVVNGQYKNDNLKK